MRDIEIADLQKQVEQLKRPVFIRLRNANGNIMSQSVYMPGELMNVIFEQPINVTSLEVRVHE